MSETIKVQVNGLNIEPSSPGIFNHGEIKVCDNKKEQQTFIVFPPDDTYTEGIIIFYFEDLPDTYNIHGNKVLIERV